jgi:hypothetical protein
MNFCRAKWIGIFGPVMENDRVEFHRCFEIAQPGVILKLQNKPSMWIELQHLNSVKSLVPEVINNNIETK